MLNLRLHDTRRRHAVPPTIPSAPAESSATRLFRSMNFVLGRRTSAADTQSSSMPSAIHSGGSNPSLLPFPLSWPFRGPSSDSQPSSVPEEVSERRNRQRRRASLQRDVRTPQVIGQSAILREDISDARFVTSNLPLRYGSHDWELVYSTMRDGTSLQTLYSNMSGPHPVIILIRDGRGHTFGCFTPAPWKVSSRYEGTGESFAFTLQPTMKAYKWSRRNSYFQLGSASSLALGGGGSFALFVDSMLERGSSGSCATFDSPCLASSEQFDIVVLEAYQVIPPRLERSACDSSCIPVPASASTVPHDRSFSY